MSAATAIADVASRPDQRKDRDGTAMPARIAAMLRIVHVLEGYGRHLLDTIEHRARWRGFATIAQCFGTAAVPVMLARIERGIMRAVALQRVLLARAAGGRDLKPRPPSGYCWRTVTGEAEPEAADQPDKATEPPATEPAPATEQSATATEPPASATEQSATATEPPASATEQSAPVTAETEPAAPAARLTAAAEQITPPGEPEHAPRRPLPGIPDALPSLETPPSMAQIMAEVRRRPIGRTLVEICRDLGVAPMLCTGPFWDRLLEAIQFYRGSLSKVMLEMLRREKRFAREQWQYPNIGLPAETIEGVRRELGFLIGEPPVDPHRAAPASGDAAVPRTAAETVPRTDAEAAPRTAAEAAPPTSAADQPLPPMTFIAPLGTGPP
ncbi:MAG TPA: hypothetical protein VMB34_18875 [Acetobacteraceae bacterium]|nr:hypothetical protein [Acetobacteraceae bacterium]